MDPTPSAEILSLVVVGQFNPAIVTPSWLEREQLASPEEVAASTLKLIHPDVSEFSIGEKNVQLLRERLAVTTSDTRYEEAMRDLAVGILGLLRHTPTTMVGLNYEAHFKMATVDSWHEKGHQLAPKEPWTGLTKKPGLMSLTMRDSEREEGHRDITVGPLSPQVLRVFVNDHYKLGQPEASEAQACIEKNWRSSIADSRRIARELAR
jgi:hypothetical protein